MFLYSRGIHYNNGQYGQDDEFHGRVSYFNESLKHGNASIKIRDAKISDCGNFTCLFPHLDPKKRITTEVIVGKCYIKHFIIIYLLFIHYIYYIYWLLAADLPDLL